MNFAAQLSLVLEDAPSTGPNPLQSAMEIVHKLEGARQVVTNLQHELATVVQSINGDLALGVRRQLPGLNVGIDPEGCKIGYRSQTLVFNPAIENGVWEVSGSNSRFLNKFKRDYSVDLRLDLDIGNIVHAIVNYFTTHFRSLNEDIQGSGIILVENKHTSLSGLVEWIQSRRMSKVINTRLARRIG